MRRWLPATKEVYGNLKNKPMKAKSVPAIEPDFAVQYNSIDSKLQKLFPDEKR